MLDCYCILKCGLVLETGGKASGDEHEKVTKSFLTGFYSLSVRSKGIRI